jgi:hypothetical protein
VEVPARVGLGLKAQLLSFIERYNPTANPFAYGRRRPTASTGSGTASTSCVASARAKGCLLSIAEAAGVEIATAG